MIYVIQISSNNRFDLTQGIVMVPAESPGAGTTPTPFAGQAYVRATYCG